MAGRRAGQLRCGRAPGGHGSHMMSSFFKDVDNINITGGFFNASQPHHNGKWALVDERRH